MMLYNGKILPDWLVEKILSMRKPSTHVNTESDVISVLLSDYIERKEVEIKTEKAKKPDTYGEEISYSQIFEDFGLGILNKAMGFGEIVVTVEEELYDKIDFEVGKRSRYMWDHTHRASQMEIYTAGGKIIIRK